LVTNTPAFIASTSSTKRKEFHKTCCRRPRRWTRTWRSRRSRFIRQPEMTIKASGHPKMYFCARAPQVW